MRVPRRDADDKLDRVVIDTDAGTVVSYEVSQGLVVEPELVLDMTAEAVDYTIN